MIFYEREYHAAVNSTVEDMTRQDVNNILMQKVSNTQECTFESLYFADLL